MKEGGEEGKGESILSSTRAHHSGVFLCSSVVLFFFGPESMLIKIVILFEI